MRSLILTAILGLTLFSLVASAQNRQCYTSCSNSGDGFGSGSGNRTTCTTRCN